MAFLPHNRRSKPWGCAWLSRMEVECWTVFVLVCSWLVVPLLLPPLLIALVF
jgi:hypothetical protein